MALIKWTSLLAERVREHFWGRNSHIQDARDADTFMMIEFYSFSKLDPKTFSEMKVLDIGGRGLAASLLSNFCSAYTSSSNLAGINNTSLFQYTDFSKLDFQELSQSFEAYDLILCPETFHLLHSGRYEGTLENPLAQENFLRFVTERSKVGTKLIISVPINPNQSENSFHNIYDPAFLIGKIEKHGWKILKSAFSPYRNQSIQTSLELRKVYNLRFLKRVDFCSNIEGSNFSWVIGFFEFEFNAVPA